MWIDTPNGLCNTSRVAEFKIEESSGGMYNVHALTGDVACDNDGNVEAFKIFLGGFKTRGEAKKFVSSWKSTLNSDY